MLADLLILVLFAGGVAVSAALGWRSGTLQQVTQWAGLALGKAVARPFALVAVMVLARDYGIIPLEYRVGISVFLFFAFYVIGTLIAGHLLKRYIAHRVHTHIDQTGGLLLAAGKGAVMMFALLSVLACFERPLQATLRVRGPLWDGSRVMRLVSRNNFFSGSPMGRMIRLARLMEAARDPRQAKALAGDPEFAAIINDPKLKASLQDEKLARALREGHWFALQKDPRIKLLLDDPNITGVLSDPLDWGED